MPLSIWFAAAAVQMVGAEHVEVLSFLGEPVNAILMLLFIATTLGHMALGIEMIVGDYVHQDAMKIALLVLTRFAMWGVGVTAGFAVLRIAI